MNIQATTRLSDAGIKAYRSHLHDLADRYFVVKGSHWASKRSKRSRELNKAAIRLSDDQLALFRRHIADAELHTRNAYKIRQLIKDIQDGVMT